MAEDRDQLFEKALARHFRAEHNRSLCLDAETLAAYQEHSLPPEELVTAKKHVASCARCQEVLAQLEATEELRAVEEDLQVVASPTRGMAIATQKLTQLTARKSTALRWAVPAGAIAAGLLLFGLREFRLREKTAPAAPEIAENRPELPPAAAYSTAPKDLDKEKTRVESDELRETIPENLKKQSDAGDRVLRDGKNTPVLASPRAIVPPAEHDKNALVSPRVLVPESREHNKRLNAPGMEGPSAAAAQRQANQAIQNSGAPIGGATPQAQAAAPQLDTTQAEIRSGKAAIAGKAAAPAPPSPAPAPNSAPPKTEYKASAGAGFSQAEVVTRADTAKAAEYSSTANRIGSDIRVAVPGGKEIWSVGNNGQIFYSKDGGRLWILQSSGVTANLTGGSAPSEKVCWIAGASGTLLRTTDGGQHWTALQTPISGDVGGVSATDAQHASIWDVANRVRYDTSDAGASWKQIAKE